MLGTERLGSLIVHYGSDVGDFLKGSADVSKTLTDQQKYVLDHEANFRKMGMAITAVGVGMTGFAAMAVKSYSDFESAAAKANTMAGLQGEAFDTMKRKAMDMAANTAFSSVQVLDAFYKLFSAGLDMNQVLAATPEILNLTIGTFSDFEMVSETVSVAAKAFNIAFTETGRITDIMAGGINSSNLNMERLSESMKYAAPSASALGLSLEDTVATLAAFHDKGMMGSMAGTSFQQVVMALTGDNKKFKASLETMGLSMDDINLRSHSLADVMAVLQEKGYTAEQAFNDFSVRGGRAMATLLNVLPTEWERYEKAVNTAGNAQRMMEEATGTFAQQLFMLKSSLEVLMTALGEGLGEQAKGLVMTLRDLVNDTSTWVQENKKLAGILMETTAGVGGLATAGGLWLTLVPSMTKALTGLFSASVEAGGAMGTLGKHLGNMPLLLSKIGAVGAAAFIGWQIGSIIRDVAGLESAVEKFEKRVEGQTAFAIQAMKDLEIKQKALVERMKELDGEDLTRAQAQHERLIKAQEHYAKSYMDGINALGGDEAEAARQIASIVGTEQALQFTNSTSLRTAYHENLLAQIKSHNDTVLQLEMDSLDTLAQKRFEAQEAIVSADIESRKRFEKDMESHEKALLKITEDGKKDIAKAHEDHAANLKSIEERLADSLKQGEQDLYESLRDIQRGYVRSREEAEIAYTRKVEDAARDRKDALKRAENLTSEELYKINLAYHDKVADAKLDFKRRLEDLQRKVQQDREDLAREHEEESRAAFIAYEESKAKEQADFEQKLITQKQKHLDAIAAQEQKNNDDLARLGEEHLEKVQQINAKVVEEEKKAADAIQQAKDAQKAAMAGFIESIVATMDTLSGEISGPIDSLEEVIWNHVEAFGSVVDEQELLYAALIEATKKGWAQTASDTKEKTGEIKTDLGELQTTMDAAFGKSWYPELLANMVQATTDNWNAAAQAVTTQVASIILGLATLRTGAETELQEYDNIVGDWNTTTTTFTKEELELYLEFAEKRRLQREAYLKKKNEFKDKRKGNLDSQVADSADMVDRVASIHDTEEQNLGSHNERMNEIYGRWREQREFYHEEIAGSEAVMVGNTEANWLKLAKAFADIDSQNMFVSLSYQARLREWIAAQEAHIEGDDRLMTKWVNQHTFSHYGLQSAWGMTSGVIGNSLSMIKQAMEDAVGASWYTDYLDTFVSVSDNSLSLTAEAWERLKQQIFTELSHIKGGLDDAVVHSWYTGALRTLSRETLINLAESNGLYQSWALITDEQLYAVCESWMDRNPQFNEEVAKYLNTIAKGKDIYTEGLELMASDTEKKIPKTADVFSSGLDMMGVISEEKLESIASKWESTAGRMQAAMDWIRRLLSEAVGSSWYVDYMEKFSEVTDEAVDNMTGAWLLSARILIQSLLDKKAALKDAVGDSWYTEHVKKLGDVTLPPRPPEDDPVTRLPITDPPEDDPVTRLPITDPPADDRPPSDNDRMIDMLLKQFEDRMWDYLEFEDRWKKETDPRKKEDIWKWWDQYWWDLDQMRLQLLNLGYTLPPDKMPPMPPKWFDGKPPKDIIIGPPTTPPKDVTIEPVPSTPYTQPTRIVTPIPAPTLYEPTGHSRGFGGSPFAGGDNGGIHFSPHIALTVGQGSEQLASTVRGLVDRTMLQLSREIERLVS